MIKIKFSIVFIVFVSIFIYLFSKSETYKIDKFRNKYGNYELIQNEKKIKFQKISGKQYHKALKNSILLKNMEKNGRNENKKDRKIRNEIRKILDPYHYDIPKDKYLEEYANLFIKYKKKKNTYFPYLGANQEEISTELTSLDTALCDLKIPDVKSMRKIKKKSKIKPIKCFENNYLDKGVITELKPLNYFDIKKEAKKNNKLYKKFPKREDLSLNFKCQRNYMVCNTNHTPIDFYK